MATDPAPYPPGMRRGENWLTTYRNAAGRDDVLRGDEGRGGRWWRTLLDGLAHVSDGSLAQMQDRIARQVKELGTAFRLPGEASERAWPLSAIPLLIGEDEWEGIAAGVCQRADLMERVLDDIYGAQTLVRQGALPAALVAGSPNFWRSMIGVPPPGGRRLHIYAVDLARGPDGEWRVLADHARAPAGAGYALENRLAASRVMGTLQTRLNVERLAPFFSAFRAGLAAVCHRDDPRIALLTPGRYNQSYAEQAHLARYMGLMLVEGADLAVRDGHLFVRTIEGLKRVDAVWRRIDTRFLDPLAFDSHSAIGVPGLMDAVHAGSAVIANAPGAGVMESAGMAAFLPLLSRRLTGERLRLPSIATWWCGQPREQAVVEASLDDLLIVPSFGDAPPCLPGGRPMLGARLDGAARARLLAGMARRPQDYVGQEVVRLSSMPAVADGALVARPFTLRVFAARDGNGDWTVMPGGFARLGGDPDPRAAVMGEGAFSADVCIVARKRVAPVTLLPANIAIRRNPGTLPARAADNLFWLGRYLERGEATVRLVRAALGGTIDTVGGAALVPATIARLTGLLIASGAAPTPDDEDEDVAPPDVPTLAREALDGEGWASVRGLLASVHAIAGGTRDRLSADVWRLVDAAPPARAGDDAAGLLDQASALLERFAGLAGLAAENMGRTSAWRFHDLGRRIERGALVCRQLRALAGDEAGADDLTTLLDLNDSQISYRARYLTGLALAPVRDLIALDPFNPRALAFQVDRLREHLEALPRLRDDGMAEEPQRLAIELAA
ncbi:MAG: circularly permuted type 2 ATP-grasp protein, partial [Sphingomonas sp.]